LPNVGANSVNLYYEMAGESGDPIVLVHGSWGDHSNWRPVVPGLAENFRVLTYDRRGHSKSEKTETQGSADEDAIDLAALLSRLDLAPAHVVGNSFGSTIALKLAVRQPSIFRSLTVHEPALFGVLADDPATLPMLMEVRERRAAVVKLLEKGDRPAGARRFVETIALGPGQWDHFPPQLRETFVSNADTWLDEIRDRSSFSVELNALSKFRKPVMLTYGGKSPPTFRPVVEKLAKAIPGSKVLSYADAGHAPHLTHPEEFVRRVTEFAMSSR
jgi:pimeloyl-ACP methyl ester carboxylesterase